MVRIAPIRLSFNPKTLWFDAGDFELAQGDAVVVNTVRGEEFGHVAQPVFSMEYEQTKRLKNPLKTVERLATEEDEAKAGRCEELGMLALPIFKQMARETVPDMSPVAVEYLFGADKAVFYFESEDRVDFRELVRKLAAEFHIRVDMKQIGVRDGARMVGGIGHCGQELCCRRLGGEFNPVSIRMAKEQDLSLNPQKISGVCGRLMCCLRYEFEAYKDFHSRAPKKNAKIQTPEGEGKVVDFDVPREVISIKVGDEKPVKVPLADMEQPEEGARPKEVGEEAWQKANAPVSVVTAEALNLFTSQISREDKLAEPGKVTHVHGSGKKQGGRSRKRGSGKQGDEGKGRSGDSQKPTRKSRRRRSTTVKSDGTATTEKGAQQSKPAQKRKARIRSGNRQANSANQGNRQANSAHQGNRQANSANQGKRQEQHKNVQVGRNSSGLRANRQEKASGGQEQAKGRTARRRRRSHKAESGEGKS